jgi:hypothetical protein
MIPPPRLKDQTVSDSKSYGFRNGTMDLLRCPHVMADNFPRRPYGKEEEEDGRRTGEREKH